MAIHQSPEIPPPLPPCTGISLDCLPYNCTLCLVLCFYGFAWKESPFKLQSACENKKHFTNSDGNGCINKYPKIRNTKM